MQALKRFLIGFAIVRYLKRRIRGPKWPAGEMDLQAIESFSLPANTRFLEAARSVERVEGMFSPFSIAVMDMVLSSQQSLGARGDILEIGTYRGKSAALLGQHLHDDERLTLVDIADYLDPAAISGFRDKTHFILAPSSALQSKLPNYRARRGTFRFIHIDASHGYDETFEELRLADELLAPRGIIALDDFTNLHYSQNIAAIFKYLYTSRTRLVMLLTTDEKAYLCRKNDFNEFALLLLKRGVAEMGSRGVDAVLARTSYGAGYKAFYIRTRNAGEGVFYGKEIYSAQITGAAELRT